MKRSEMPSLDDLRAFETTARLGSVRLAADELSLTHSAVSRRITKLSNELGFDVFQKSGRGLKLTAAGEKLYLTMGRFFKELSSNINDLRFENRKQNALVLSCEPSVAMRWLIPRLAKFYAMHPDIGLNLSVGGGFVDFRRDQIDLAIRRLDFAISPDHHVLRLFTERLGPVMSPRLCDAFLKGDYIALATKTRRNAWADWLSQQPSIYPPKEIRYYDHHFLILEAAISELGVAMSPQVLAVDDINRQRLIAPVGFIEDGSDYGLLWSGQSELTQRANDMARWLTNESNISLNTSNRSP